MNELGAELDRDRRSPVAVGEYASANPLASLKDENIDAVLVQNAGCGETCRSSADDRDLGL
jgi:hypothetical protein